MTDPLTDEGMSPEKLATIRERLGAYQVAIAPLEAEAVRRAHKLLVRDAVLKERRRCLDIVSKTVSRANIRRRIEEGP